MEGAESVSADPFSGEASIDIDVPFRDEDVLCNIRSWYAKIEGEWVRPFGGVAVPFAAPAL